MKKRPEFLEVPLFLYKNEVDLLNLLPGSMENLVGRACEEYLKHPFSHCGAFGGELPEQYPLYVRIPTELAEKLQNSGLSAEAAVRALLAGIDGDYIKQRRSLAEKG